MGLGPASISTTVRIGQLPCAAFSEALEYFDPQVSKYTYPQVLKHTCLAARHARFSNLMPLVHGALQAWEVGT
jgi:hypothetical protein